VFEVTGKNPKLDIAVELENRALDDDYFRERKLYPNFHESGTPHLKETRT